MVDDPQMAEALALANRLWQECGGLSGEIVRALADDKISVFEGLEMGLHAVQLGSALAATITDGGSALHERLLYVLEYSELVLRAGAPVFRQDGP